MKKKLMQLIALFCMEIIIFFPMGFASALTITSGQNPARDVNATSATIEWLTDADATSSVQYGKTSSLGMDKTIADLDTYHSVVLENLEPEQTYFFQMLSVSSQGEAAFDDNSGSLYTFFTSFQPQTTPPVISNVSIASKTATTASIRWQTDENSDSRIYFSQAGMPLTDKRESGSFLKTHVLTIPAQEGLDYDYVVSSCDPDGNCANSTKQTFSGGIDITAPVIAFNIPSWSTDSRIDIEGPIEPRSTIEIFLEGVKARHIAPQYTESGYVIIYNFVLPAVENNVTVVATDEAGNEASKGYHVIIDQSPPALRVSGVPNITDMQSATITVNISEPCTIIFESGVIDEVPPVRATGLAADSSSPTFIKLEWGEMDEADLDEYAVYRLSEGAVAQWKRIAVTGSNLYQDAKIQSGKQYSYRVSAVDEKCNEGPLSDIVVGVASLGAPRLMLEPPAVNLTCVQRRDAVYKDGGSFSHQISFEEGNNRVIVKAIDRAGHVATFTKELIYDMEPPVIESTNLAELSPTYIQTVTVTGKVSEEAGIVILVNGDSEYSGQTNPDGTFSATIDLKRANPAADGMSGSLSAGVGVGTGAQAGAGGGSWTNHIKIVATDLVGRVSAPAEEDVILTLCGYGSWFRTDIGGNPTSIYGTAGLTPAILNPRSMLDGTEIISFPINISYVGGYGAVISNVIIRNIRKDFISEEMEEDYDVDWVSEPSIMCTPDKKTCFVQMAVRAPDPEPAGENWTMFEKEENISMNRAGDCLTSIVGASIGCVKVPMLLEINFQEQRPMAGAPPGAGTFPGQAGIQTMVQKECWDIEIAIDRRIPPDVIPEDLLEKMANLFDAVANLTDRLLEPLNKVKEIVFMMCAAMWIVQFVNTFSVNYRCKTIVGNTTAGAVAGAVSAAASFFAGGKFEVDIARIGRCEEEYPDSEESKESRTNCLSCETALRNQAKGDWTMRQLCDRIFCPSAPTLQKYVKDKAKAEVKEVKGPTSKQTFLVGSSCSCDLSRADTCVKISESARDKVTVPYDTAKKLYEWYTQEKKLGANSICAGPHELNPRCCGYEYMREWGSACGVPFSDDTLFNEIKQSLCLAAQSTNQPSTIGGLSLSSGGQATDSVTCSRSLANAGGGLCDPQGRTNVEPVPTNKNLKPELTSGASALSPAVSANDKGLYVCLFPPVEGGARTNYEAKFCYATTRATTAGTSTATTGASASGTPAAPAATAAAAAAGQAAQVTTGFIPMQTSFGFYVPPDRNDWVLTSLFGTSAEDRQREDASKKEFCNRMAQIAVNGRTGCEEKYTDIKNAIGDPDQQFIVNPVGGVGLSFICICLTGITAYLSLINRVSKALANCFRTILLTGDGSAGACEAVVSTYVCDLIYEIIKCASKRYNSGPSRSSTGGSFGDFFGALSRSGTDVSSSVSGRYGASATWRAMFVEQKLMHAVCLWIFTGTWDVDFETLFEGEEMLPPVASIGMLYPCKRRFKSFNPLTTPSGLANWEYEFGVGLIPGADLTYTLKLICSEGYSCDASEGFLNGQCDCRGGKRELIVTDPQLLGRLTRSENLDARVFFPVQGSGDTSVRYDKAVLSWSWTDNNGQAQTETKECEVMGVGGSTPAFCNFDIAHGVFRCSIGFETDNWVRLNSASPSYPQTQEYFKLGDPLQFYLDVEQGIPSNPTCTGQNCEYTKYLKGTIYNHLGGVVWSNDMTPPIDPKALNTGGQDIFAYPAQPRVPVLTRESFAATGTAAGLSSYSCLGETFAPAGVSIPANGCRDSSSHTTCTDVCGSSKILSISGTPTGGEKTLILAMSHDHYKVYYTNLRPNANPPATPDIDHNYFQDTSGGSPPVQKTAFRTDTTAITISTVTGTGLNFTVWRPAANKYYEIGIHILPPQAAGSSNQCAELSTFAAAQNRKWRADFKIYRARQEGATWTISDTVEAEKSAEFVAVCMEGPQMPPSQAPQPAAPRPPAQPAVTFANEQSKSDPSGHASFDRTTHKGGNWVLVGIGCRISGSNVADLIGAYKELTVNPTAGTCSLGSMVQEGDPQGTLMTKGYDQGVTDWYNWGPESSVILNGSGRDSSVIVGVGFGADQDNCGPTKIWYRTLNNNCTLGALTPYTRHPTWNNKVLEKSLVATGTIPNNAILTGVALDSDANNILGLKVWSRNLTKTG